MERREKRTYIKPEIKKEEKMTFPDRKSVV